MAAPVQLPRRPLFVFASHHCLYPSPVPAYSDSRSRRSRSDFMSAPLPLPPAPVCPSAQSSAPASGSRSPSAIQSIDCRSGSGESGLCRLDGNFAAAVGRGHF